MSRLNEREIARKLAERDELEPPAGLLDKIKSEIPDSLRIGTDAPAAERRRPLPPQQRWLIAASLIATVGAGLFALRVREEAPSLDQAARPAPAVAAPAAPEIPPSPKPPAARRREDAAEEKEKTRLRSLGYVSSGTAAAPSGVERGVVGGVAGGFAGSKKENAPVTTFAAPPAAPPAAAPPPAPPAPVAKPAEERDEAIAVTAESPLADRRQAEKGAAVSQTELEKVPTARDPWTVLQKAPGVATDRINVGGNESGQQSQYVGPGAAGDQAVRSVDGAVISDMKALGSAPAYYDFDSFEEMQVTTGDRPFTDAAKHRLSTFGLDVGGASFIAARRSIAAGRLPAPASVRAEEFVNSFDYGDAPPAYGDFALKAEGAPTPFVQGPRYRLLRFNLRGREAGAGAAVARDAEAQVEFDPAAVARYRLIGYEGQAAAGGRHRDRWDVAAGRSVTALYEVELQPDAPRGGRVATLRLRYRSPETGKPRETEMRLDLADLAPTWEKAAPGFRLAALVAQLAEILEGSPWAKESLPEVARQARSLEKARGGQAAELADLAEKAARIKGAGSSPSSPPPP